MIQNFQIGPIKAIVVYGQLDGTYTPTETGMYTLSIKNWCSIDPTEDKLYNYIDNISIKPEYPFVRLDNINIPSQTGGTVNFDMAAGLAHSNEYYWIMMSVSGNLPGIKVSGVTIPLNNDILFQLGLAYPYFPGTTNFFGQLDFFGMQTASMTLPPDNQMAYTGIPIYFSLVFLAPGPSLPVTYASPPLHIKYVP